MVSYVACIYFVSLIVSVHVLLIKVKKKKLKDG